MKRFGEPSWKRLVEVVGDPAGGANPAVANQIAEKHRATGTVHKKQSFSINAAGTFGRFRMTDKFKKLC